MKQFDVTGMSCAACSSRVEKAVSALSGVDSCSVNLLTNSMTVSGSCSDEEIIAAVENAGYGAAPKGKSQNENKNDKKETDKEFSKMKKRLVSSLVFLAALMYISMGHTMWGWSLPSFFEHNAVAVGLLEMLLTICVMVINQKFFINGAKGVLHRAPNMDTLVAMGSSASFLWSVFVLFKMTTADTAAHEMLHDLWFESAAMILTLITVGKMLEAKAKGKTTSALKGLLNLAAKTATVIIDGKETEVPASSVKKGDIFVVRPGQSIPVDAVILQGSCSADESSLTGESIPVDKKEGDTVYCATINKTGFIKCRAEKVGEDTTLSQIVKMVSDAAATKAPIAKVADKVSGVFVPTVIIIALITIFVWLLLGKEIGFALARGISVLVISCPCALGLATPVAIMVGSGTAAKNSILFKTAVSLEETGRTQIVVLDKTGTVTKGTPEVTDIIPFGKTQKSELLKYAYSLEKNSEHPLSKAIEKKAQQDGLDFFAVTNFKAVSGKGLEASLFEKRLFAGNTKYITEAIDLSEDILAQTKELSKSGKTPLLFALDNELLGIIAVADVIREESKEAVKQLKNMNIRVVMLTGDNKQTANAIAKAAGIDEVISDVLPNEKETAVRQLKAQGKITMVGDGINDAPALTSADIGIAIGAGTDIAIDAADVVLTKSQLTDVPAAIRLSKAVLRNIHENLFWAFIYNCFGIPLAAGVFISLFGWQLNPMFGAAAMSLSSFCVVSNALRLGFFKVHSTKRDKKIKQNKQKKESFKMTKTMKIEGMMCPHCEARVKKILEELPEVSEAVVSHTSGTAVLTLSAEADDAVLKNTVENQGYKVTDII